MANLGKLSNFATLIEASKLDETAKKAFLSMLAAMAEIDPSRSAYEALKPGEQDECPTGQHFNDLWDAILDEIGAAVSAAR